MPSEGMLRASRYRELSASAIEEFKRRKAMLEDELFVDGYPPFNEPVDDATAYLRLATMRQAGDPAGYTREAEKAYAEFQRQFGPPPMSPPVR